MDGLARGPCLSRLEKRVCREWVGGQGFLCLNLRGWAMVWIQEVCGSHVVYVSVVVEGRPVRRECGWEVWVCGVCMGVYWSCSWSAEHIPERGHRCESREVVMLCPVGSRGEMGGGVCGG